MRFNRMVLILAATFAGFPRAGVGQCLDTRTLLDSIYSISLPRLNAIRQLRGASGNSGALRSAVDSVYRTNGRHRTDIYQPLLIDKVFQKSEGYSSPLDGAYVYRGRDFNDIFITKIRDVGASKFSLVLLSDAFQNLYLATLSADYVLINFVAFETEEFPLHVSPTSAKNNAHLLVRSGVTSTLNDSGVITQIAWSREQNGQTRAAPHNKSRTKHYRIDANGTISAYQVVSKGKAVGSVQRR